MTMTRLQQEQKLRKKLADLEQKLLDYYRSNPGQPPDGSFMLHVYRLGYEAGRRREKREEKQS